MFNIQQILLSGNINLSQHKKAASKWQFYLKDYPNKIAAMDTRRQRVWIMF